MPHGSYSLGETAVKQRMVRLVCDKCGRRGQYRIDRLLEQYCPDIAMPDLRHELAQCPPRRDMSSPVRRRLVSARPAMASAFPHYSHVHFPATHSAQPSAGGPQIERAAADTAPLSLQQPLTAAAGPAPRHALNPDRG